MIILVLYIQWNLRLKTRQMLQNGIIIFTFVWCLKRMVNFTNDSMTSVMTDFPKVNFPYLISYYIGIPCIWCFYHSWYVMLGYVRNNNYEEFLCRGPILVSKWLNQGYSSRSWSVVIQTLFTNLTLLCHLIMLKGLFSNCGISLVSSKYKCIVTGATCGAGNALPEHLISLPLGELMISPIYYICIT